MEGVTLLDIAKNAIKDELFCTESIDKLSLERDNEYLSDERACFVTLYLDGELRGCIGSLQPHRKLIDDIMNNAKSAAFQDYRFQPLSKNEFEKIDIEISLLTLPKILIYESLEELKDKINIGIDGVILQKNHNKATFLPQVWEQLPTFESFFEHLCLKAGLCDNCLKQFPQIYTYQVKKFT